MKMVRFRRRRPVPNGTPGSAQQGSNEYLALGCTACHTQQVRLEEAGFDVERGWGDSVPF